jgi:hypothetical protein
MREGTIAWREQKATKKLQSVLKIMQLRFEPGIYQIYRYTNPFGPTIYITSSLSGPRFLCKDPSLNKLAKQQGVQAPPPVINHTAMQFQP